MAKSDERKLIGQAVSPGIAVGRVYAFCPFEAQRISASVAEDQIPAELARLDKALDTAKAELTVHIGRLDEVVQKEKRDILEAHRLILEDAGILEGIKGRITREHLGCETAVWDAYASFIEIFESMDDPMFRERSLDLADVRARILRCLSGRKEADLSRLSEPCVLAAKMLSPSDTANLPESLVQAIITETGGSTSHTAILARSAGIPAVLGIANLMESVSDGTEVIVDALEGIVIPAPDEALRVSYLKKQASLLEEKRRTQLYLSDKAVTTDGIEILTELNLGGTAEAHSAEAAYADGVGLLRTEFLYMSASSLPDEETQYESYREILEAFGERPVILRTLDIGGDKELSYLELPQEENPFLGERALRFCLRHEDLFRTQLRAAYRASVYGNLWMMFPMVGNIGDFRKAKAICINVCRELEEEGIPFRKDVPLGIMIEIPSAALSADLLARETDFASIGTNDLCQYVCAADRMNESVRDYYRSDDPGLLRLIAYAAEAYADAGKPLGVCGEMAGDPASAKILVGLGVRTLSMNRGALSGVRAALSQTSMEAMQQEAQCLLYR